MRQGASVQVPGTLDAACRTAADGAHGPYHSQCAPYAPSAGRFAFLVQKHFAARGWGSQFGQYVVANMMRKLGHAGHAFARATMPTSAAMRPSGGRRSSGTRCWPAA